MRNFSSPASAAFVRARRTFLAFVLCGFLTCISAQAGVFRSKEKNFSLELPEGWTPDEGKGFFVDYQFTAPDGQVRLKVGTMPAKFFPGMIADFRDEAKARESGGPYVEGAAEAGDLRFVTFTATKAESRDEVVWIAATSQFMYTLVASGAKNDPALLKVLASFRLLTPEPQIRPDAPKTAVSPPPAPAESAWDFDRIARLLKTVLVLLSLGVGIFYALISRGLRGTSFPPGVGSPANEGGSEPPSPPQS